MTAFEKLRDALGVVPDDDPPLKEKWQRFYDALAERGVGPEQWIVLPVNPPPIHWRAEPEGIPDTDRQAV